MEAIFFSCTSLLSALKKLWTSSEKRAFITNCQRYHFETTLSDEIFVSWYLRNLRKFNRLHSNTQFIEYFYQTVLYINTFFLGTGIFKNYSLYNLFTKVISSTSYLRYMKTCLRQVSGVPRNFSRWGVRFLGEIFLGRYY